MSREILDAIERAGGAVRFDRFVELALYGEEGFYSRSGRAGRRGDFMTSPEVGPLFGVVLGRYFDAQWRRLGKPDEFTVVDAGAGPGTLARSVLAANLECRHALRYVAVEISAAQRADHPDGIVSTGSLGELGGPVTGVILANEVLDNLPFRMVVFDGRWREALVGVDGDRLVEHLGPGVDGMDGLDGANQPPFLPARPPHGTRAPLLERAARWITDARSRLSDGAVLVIDYASPSTAGMVGGNWRRWLRTYRGHQRGGHYLADPGRQDITVELALDQLPEPDAVRTQAQFLRLHGLDELVDDGRAAWESAASSPDVAALRMRSRAREAEALTDPVGLGAFITAEYQA